MGERNRKLGRADWLRRALEVLEERGVDGVRIQPLAEDLGVTRGSFYWHFKDRAELLDALLEYWEVALTDSVMLLVKDSRGNARDRLRALLEDVVLNDRGRYDIAVFAWARFDAATAERVAMVLTRRRTYVARLFGKMGFPPAEADARAQLLVAFLAGQFDVRWEGTDAQLRRLLRRHWRVLTQGAPDKGRP